MKVQLDSLGLILVIFYKVFINLKPIDGCWSVDNLALLESVLVDPGKYLKYPPFTTLEDVFLISEFNNSYCFSLSLKFSLLYISWHHSNIFPSISKTPQGLGGFNPNSVGV
mgnify:CR=1 FL=1